MLRRVPGGWKAFSRRGRPLSKKAKSRAAALRQLRAVEAAKRRRRRRR